MLSDVIITPFFGSEDVKQFIRNDLNQSFSNFVATWPSMMINDMISKINTYLWTYYPESVNLGNGLSFSTAVLSKPTIYGNYLNFPMDGTIFKTSNGYVGYSFPSISLINSSIATDMSANINNKLFNSLANSINSIQGFTYNTSALGVKTSI